MAAFVGSVTGNWNTGAAWGNVGDVEGVDYPGSADTFTMNTSVSITVPSGVTSAATSGTFDGTLIINGTLNIGGNLTVNEDADGFTMGAGSSLVFSAGGSLVQDTGTVNSSSTPITILGTVDSRVTITGDGATSNISYAGTTNKMWADHNIQYTDFSGFTNIRLADNLTTGQTLTLKNVTFTGYDVITCMAGMNLAANHTIDGVDLRDTAGATQRWDWGGDYGTDTGTRVFQNITMSNAGQLRNLGLETTLHGTKITNLVVHNSEFLNAGAGKIDIDGWFIDNIALAGQQDIAIHKATNGYYFSDAVNAHPFGAGGNSSEFTDNIVECTGVDVSNGGDGIIANSLFTGTLNVLRNIFMWGSDGTAINAVGSNPTGTVNFDHNTVVVTNTAANSITDNFPLLIKSQTADWAGTVNCRSNIAYFVSGITAPTRAAGITLATTTADQINNTDYNVFGLPDIWNEYVNVVITGKTYPGAGFGGSDFSLNPNFVDETRNLASWDASLGGAGTVANAITEMLKYNSTSFNANYTVANAIAYVQAGFAPTNVDIKDAGHDGVTVGAVEYQSPLSYGARGLVQRIKNRRWKKW